MANSKKPRKKKIQVAPAVKERRLALRDKQELFSRCEEAIGACEDLVKHFDKEISKVKDVFTPEQAERYETIKSRTEKDVVEFRAKLAEVDSIMEEGIEVAYKNDKIHPEEKFKLMEYIIGYGEVVETTVNYMGNVQDELESFVNDYNKQFDDEASQPKDKIEDAVVVTEEKA